MNTKTILCPEKSVLLEQNKGLQLWHLGMDRAAEMDSFVYGVYSQAFLEDGKIPFTLEEMQEIGREFFPRARTCAVTLKDGRVIGTWGLVFKELGDESFELPIERKFKIRAPEIPAMLEANGIQYLFNGWRTAIDKETLTESGMGNGASIFVFDWLLRGLTIDFGDQIEKYLGVAEMELLVLKYHRRIGIPWKTLGTPLHYWGRDRFPCAFLLREYRDFMKEHHPDRYEFVYGRRTY